MMERCVIPGLALALGGFGCGAEEARGAGTGAALSGVRPAPEAAALEPASPIPEMGKPATKSVLSDRYPWLGSWRERLPELSPLEARFRPPEGFSRIAVVDGSFAAWLRGLPIRLDRTHPLSYDGSPVPSPARAVVLLDVGDRDLQQCADSVIRLHAEYLWHGGKTEAVAYHFTSGDRSAWSDWREGERFRVAGSRVTRVKDAPVTASHPEFRRYLDHVFRYAGTRSLRFDTDAIPVDADLVPGDIFVAPGGPGHAVMILDVATHPDGRRAALIGEGFMPAQDFHVVAGFGGRVLDGVWYLLPRGKGATLKVPTWGPFTRGMARRFRGTG